MHGKEDVVACNDMPRGQCIVQGGESLHRLLKKHKLSEDEYSVLKSILGRSPTLAEMGVFSAMWSEHCSYKSSRIHLKKLPATGKNVVVGPGENAGVVRLWGDLCVAFKMESHNHPSYIDPVQGAATGVGGILRDVFCMGARPVANLNALRFGAKEHPKTPWLVEGVVRGIGSYGNCVGIPTVGGSVHFNSCYNGNNLVNAMSLGLIREDRIFKGTASGPGNLVIYVGSATGRDGIHGATMASDSFASGASQEREAVQVGDPFWEKLLLEATLEVLEAGLVAGIQDMGAAGLTSSLFEMADRGNSGLEIDLNKVPVRATGMSAYELLLSESQERMAMVVRPENLSALEKILEKWELEHAVIGKVCDTGRFQAYYHGLLEVDVPVAPLVTQAPVLDRPRKNREQGRSERSRMPDKEADPDPLTFAELCQKGMKASPGNLAQIYSQYDHHIGNRTCLGPAEQGAAVLWIRGNSEDYEKGMPKHLGLSAVADCCEHFTSIDPYKGSVLSVLKAARMISAAGGQPLAITDCLNYGNPGDPEVMDDFVKGVEGIRDACLALNIPVVSGNVSLYNETDGKSIAPTPMIGMAGRHEDIRHALPARLRAAHQQVGAMLYLLHDAHAGEFFAGSLFEGDLKDPWEGRLPEISWDAELEGMAFVRSLGLRRLAVACRDVGAGGLALTGLKMLAGHGAGIEFSDELTPGNLFGNRYASWLMVVPAGMEKSLSEAASTLRYTTLIRAGRLNQDGQIKWRQERAEPDCKGELIRR